ncbi:N-acetylmuramoyl-L-alanine amidase [Pelotomaculum propionicicum]|uniref:N-acetylmuramoyl-L-alanine amidase n=1 Tax=Pelotomaculum propionicicum TaxID=258475 RepID=UPI003B787B5E
MSPVIIKTIRIRKRYLAALVALVFLSFYLTRAQNDRAERQAVTAMSQALASRVIVVDPGHGGADTGVAGKSGALEKEITLAVSRLLADNLAQAGAMVLMTRETDSDLSNPVTAGLTAKKREDLERRVAIANDNRADLYISVHVNNSPAADRSGARVYYQRGAVQGGKAGRHMQSELAQVLKNTGSQPAAVDYYITRNTSMAAVVVEAGYISNEAEEKLLLDPAYQGKLAWAIYAGAVKYFALENPPVQRPPENDKLIQTFKEQEQKTLKEP